MAKRALIAVAGGGLSATAWLSITMGVPGGLLMSYFAPLPLLWVGLTTGVGAAGIAGLAGMITAGLISGIGAAETFVAVHALPAWMVVTLALLRRHPAGSEGDQAVGWVFFSPGVILASLAVVAAIGLIVLGIAERGEESIEDGVRTFVESVVAAPPSGGFDAHAVLAPLTPVFLGFIAMAWQVMVVANGLLAQSLAVQTGKALRPSPRWAATVVPDWLSWILVGAAALALVTGGDVGYLARNATVALAVPFFFVGLAVVHRLAARAGAGRVVLAVFYVMLVVMFLVVAVAVTALGVLDQWLGWNRDNGGNNMKRRQ